MLEHGIVPASAGGYEIANSLRFEADDSSYLSKTFSSGSTTQWTWSGWVKRTEEVYGDRLFACSPGSADSHIKWLNGQFNFQYYNGSSTVVDLRTTPLYRDPSAWYHFVVIYDSANATSTDRVRIYVNGTRVTDFSTATYPSSSLSTNINSANTHYIGRAGQANSSHFSGYLAEVNFIDGQALDASNFGETGDYGEWKPIRYTGTYGSNGFYLDFENSGSLGADVSGNGNNWTPTNLAATDQMLDSPTNNFCTLNPLEKASSVTLSEGNLRAYPTTDYDGIRATIGQTTGKWYFEAAVYVVTGNVDDVGIGITGDDTALTNMYAVSPAVWAVGGSILKNNAVVQSGLGSFAVGDIIGVALNLDSGTVQFYKNNTAYGSAETLPTNSAEWLPSVYGANTRNQYLNFGQDSSFAGNKTAQGNADGNGYGDFYYTPPSGFLALCTQNLPDPTVIPSEHFNTVLYTGDGTTGRAITGVGFQPDLTWLKRRDVAWWHVLQDSVRTAGNVLSSNVTNAEDTAPDGTITSFDSDGFTVDAGGNWTANYNGESVTSWNWKANGSGVSNTNGTITSTVSANQDAGFSIVSYTGNGSDATIGHGLSSTPELLIIKCRSTTGQNWVTWYKDFSATEILRLDSTSAKLTGRNEFNSTLPTSSVFSIEGSNNSVGGSHTYIAYCFHSVDGYSKVGSYTGNGSADGTFVYTGFRPAYVMIKRSDGTSNWELYDTARNSYNGSDLKLYPNLSAAEGADAGGDGIDHLSNGFKLRSTTGGINVNTGAFIYLAFSEQPFKHTNAR